MKLFDKTLDTLAASMDVRLQRHGLLAGNLANADTPGYASRDLDFASAMAAAGSDAGARAALPAVPPHEGFIPVVDSGAPSAPLAGLPGALQLAQGLPGNAQAGSATPSLDGNKVDLDRTMAALATNALQYGAASKAAGKKLALLRYVASDGNA